MNQWNHLKQINTRIIIDIEFTNETPLHIGIGESEYLSENINQILTITYNNQTYGVIPETTLKGLLRNEAIKIASTMEATAPIIKEHIELIEEQNTINKEEIENHIEKCPICGLFGTHGLAGKLIVHAAITKTPLKTKHRQPTILIDIKTKTVKTGALSIHEAIPPNTQFKTRIIVNNPTETEKEILTKLLNNIKKVGIQIGKRKTVGYGEIKIISISTKES